MEIDKNKILSIFDKYFSFKPKPCLNLPINKRPPHTNKQYRLTPLGLKI